MPGVYVKRFTNNGSPKAQPAITIDTGMKRCVAVGFNSQGTISRLTVKQAGGTPCGVVADLFDSTIPFPPGEYPVNAPPADDVSLYRILPSQTGASGTGIETLENQMGYKYQNQDGGFTNNQRFVYLLLTPQGAVDLTTWEVVLAGEGAIG